MNALLPSARWVLTFCCRTGPVIEPNHYQVCLKVFFFFLLFFLVRLARGQDEGGGGGSSSASQG